MTSVRTASIWSTASPTTCGCWSRREGLDEHHPLPRRPHHVPHPQGLPLQVFNWHAWESLPALDEAYALTGKCLMGGLSRTDITQQNRGAIQNQIFQCFKLLGGRHQILTPGLRHPLPPGRRHALLYRDDSK